MIIRRERPGDEAAIHAVTTAAFDRPVEADLIDQLRLDPGWIPALSFVATAGTKVIGHVVATRGAVDGVPALGLGPLSVHPDHQRARVGSALVRTLIGAASALDEPLVALLGDPEYYQRFGFRRGDELGIAPPVAEWRPHFQVHALAAEVPRGTFTYAEPFTRL
ncbi:GNAT family N-acetyltransferase [Actinokineospora pegani]|uniref:GNAT family N-acetyltransferase n=1 Tax=Actinokineospora pegani TaxID=2654637 RepID=UPI0012EA0233|nr:N-acetyltransferase [Actinokineospora pegani]